MSLWLIGAGAMAQEYARVLMAQKREFDVIGRSALSAGKFESALGKKVFAGGVGIALQSGPAPFSAIVAVGVSDLADTALQLIDAGVKRILVEKPGATSLRKLKNLNRAAERTNCEVYIGYNRRYYESTYDVRRIIREDGGILSGKFEFSEWGHKIEPREMSPGVKDRWLLANSSHVIDLAFHLCGFPRDLNARHSGSISWHPAAARFCGAGVTQENVLFSYIADWEGPGRWSIELITRRRRLILCPMEELKVIDLGKVEPYNVGLPQARDLEFKPGLFFQTHDFLAGEQGFLCPLTEQIANFQVYRKMSGYSDC